MLVSHGAAINLGHLPPAGRCRSAPGVLGPLGNCAWSVLGRRDGHWRLLEHNVGRLPDLAPEPVEVPAAGPEDERAEPPPEPAPGRSD